MKMKKRKIEKKERKNVNKKEIPYLKEICTIKEKVVQFLKQNEDGALTLLGGILILFVLLMVLRAERQFEGDEPSEYHSAAPEEFSIEDDFLTNEKSQSIDLGDDIKVFARQNKIILFDSKDYSKNEVPLGDKKVLEARVTPDRELIAFLSPIDGGIDIFLLNTKNSQTRRLTFSGGHKENISFSSDGEHIFFISNEDTEKGEIYSVDVEKGNRTRITNNLISEKDIDVSSEGQLIFTAFNEGNYEIFSLDIETEQKKNLTNSLASETSPRFSDDGKRIVYLRQKNGKTEIFIMNSDGSEQIQLTQNMLEEKDPEFSENGSKVIFWYEGDLYEIYSEVGQNEDEKKVDL